MARVGERLQRQSREAEGTVRSSRYGPEVHFRETLVQTGHFGLRGQRILRHVGRFITNGPAFWSRHLASSPTVLQD